MKGQAPRNDLRSILFRTLLLVAIPVILLAGTTVTSIGYILLKGQVDHQLATIRNGMVFFANQFLIGAERGLASLATGPAPADQAMLESFIDQTRSRIGIVLAGADGLVHTRTARAPLSLGTDVSGQPWFTNGTSKPWWSPSSRNPADGRIVLGVAVPARAGVAYLLIDLAPFQEALEALSKNVVSTGVTVTDSNGIIIAARDRDLVEQRVQPPWYPFRGKPTAVYRPDNSGRLLEVHTSPLGSGSGWSLHLELDWIATFWPLILFVGVSLAGSTLGLFLIILIYTNRLNKMVRRVDELISGVNRVSGGSYLPVTVPDEPRELTILAARFNSMVEGVALRETSIRELNAHLEQRVKDRTRDLEQSKHHLEETLDHLLQTQSRLVQSERMAISGQLITGISHEINTPLGVSLTTATYLQDTLHQMAPILVAGESAGTGSRDSLRQVQEAADLLVHSVSKATDLMQTFRQVSVDYHEDSLVSVRVLPLIEDLLLSRDDLAALRESCVVDCPVELRMNTFPVSLAQVLGKILENTVHHFRPRPHDPNLHISVTVSWEGPQVVFRIRDNGQGIPIEQLQAIFDPFYTTGRQRGHAGLGLFIARTVTEQKLGGELEVDQGTFTTFVVRLPDREA